MSALALRGLLVAFLAAGCSVTEVPLPAGAVAVNACESDADCDGSSCSNGACVASNTELTRLIVQVTPPPMLPVFGGIAFYKTLDRQSSTGGRLDIELDPVVRVGGHVDLSEDDCVPTAPKGRSVPVDISFTPSERVLGINTSLYTASVNPEAVSQLHEFSVQIPPGTYDVYIKPKPDLACPTPPRLLLEQPIAGDWSVNLPVPEELPVDVYWPEPLEGSWVIALLDEPTGRVISTEPVLALQGYDEARAAYHHSATVRYFPVTPLTQAPDSDAESDAPDDRLKVLRLTPPRDIERPTVLSELYAGEIDQNAPLPANVTVRGQTAIAGRAVPVEATLKLIANSLDGFDSGVLAAYTRTLSVPPSGLFDIQLPPGSYSVQATPAGGSAGCPDLGPTEQSPCLAAATTTWVVATTPAVQAGKLLEFPAAEFVRGTARLWSGEVPTGASVHMNAAPSALPPNLIEANLGMTQPSPRGASGLVRSDGSFGFGADPGVFDLMIQPDPSTRFGWYVHSGVELPLLATLGTITVQPPVAYSGDVSIAGGADSTSRVVVPDALIRAYADTDGEPGGPVVQVAETWADAQGRFNLLIPHQFGPAPTRSSDPDDAE